MLLSNLAPRLGGGYLCLYEAGVGSGFSANRFLEYNYVKMKGCDVVLSERVKQLTEQYSDRFCFSEKTLYEDLKNIEDESIDIFYADNVFEHLIPDEFPMIMEVLKRKLKKNALLFLFIPNRLAGPGDVSRFYLNVGERAQGFHFMELSYTEVIRALSEYNIVPYRNIFYGREKLITVKSNKFWNTIKEILDFCINILPRNEFRKKYVALFGLYGYIMINR